MTLRVTTRRELCGELVCETAVHVGGWDPAAVADLPVVRDGLGHPLLPGTSLAGAIRAWVAGLDDKQVRDVQRLFGWLDERNVHGDPALIRIDDAHALNPATVPIVRDGVAIDRHTGSAAAGFLYEREVLPAGTRFAFRLVADEPPEKDPGVAATFDAIVEGLRGGRIPFGAARTRGLGRVRLERARVRSADLGTGTGMIAWLTGAAPWTDVAARETPDAPRDQPDRQLDIEICWHPVAPVLVKDSVEGAVVDTLPLTETDEAGQVRLLLPGASVKGVLRAHAERILRTLTGRPAPRSQREGLDVERLPGVSALFGYSPQRGTGRRDRDPARQGWRGALQVADCRSADGVTAAAWQSVVTAHPGQTDAGGTERERRRADNAERSAQRASLRERLDALNAQFSLRLSDHVAIDRWTGGAAEGLLFSVLEPQSVTWEPIRLRLYVARAGGLRRRPGEPGADHEAMALLLLVLRDLRDGWLALGFGGTRGHGQIEVEQVRFTGTALPAPWAALASRTLDDVLAHPPTGVRQAMTVWAQRFPAGVAAATAESKGEPA